MVVSEALIEWITRNVRDSQYTKGRCYVYNKAMLKFLANPTIISLQEQLDVVWRRTLLNLEPTCVQSLRA